LLRPFNTSEVKILLLENINQTAVDAFKKQGYQVKRTSRARTFRVHILGTLNSNDILHILITGWDVSQGSCWWWTDWKD
jgi:hypothetical protein